VNAAQPRDEWASTAETHSGVVFFAGDRAYKLKKPVDLGFLDFTTREARERACHREVELNRRLAPDVYLGVADVLGPDGAPCDHLVVMRRLAGDRRLSSLAARGARLDEEIVAIAHVIAAFHARAERSLAISSAASRDAVAARWNANRAGLAPFVGTGADAVVDGLLVDRCDELARRYLAGRAPLFDARAAAGRTCDGHGDLLSDDIFCLDDGPRILDCLEFDDSLRASDVLEDIAFLAMDLERLGRPELAERFLRAYREFAADNWPPSLAHLYMAYRALVRAKVECVRSRQGGPESAVHARALVDLAAVHLRAGEVRLIVVGGPPGAGKSTLARALDDALDATVLRSDEIRKELAGIPATEHAAAPVGQGIYRPEMTDRTYAELLRRARVAVEMGETVVLDASWGSAARRAAARDVAASTAVAITELRCDAPADVRVERLGRRWAGDVDASDATPDVAAALDDRFDPWPEAIGVDASVTPDASLAAALDAVRGAA
jgi:aminoglycoside phosphotransferase family enzyme/predicted kinase